MIDKIGVAGIIPQQAIATNKDILPVKGESFASFLSDALDQVNQDQLTSEAFNKALATGEVQDLHQVMIASQQSMLSLQLTIQVRNKVVEAYQEIMRMPL